MADTFNIHNYFKRGKTVVLTLRHGEEETRQWTDKCTADLLRLMKAFHTEFQNPRRKKKEVWDDVANELLKLEYTWSSEDCRKKWSNMIRTFKGIEEQRNDPGYANKRMKWPFYESMLQLLTLENSEAFPEALAVIQLLNNDPQSRISVAFSRKPNSSKAVDPFIKYPVPSHQQVQTVEAIQNTSQFLESQRDSAEDCSINLVSAEDLMEMGLSLSGQHDPMTTSDVHASSSGVIDSSIIFTQPIRYKNQPDVILPSSSVATTTQSSTVTKTSLAVRAKKRHPKRKIGGKDKKKEESMDSILSKFIETTNKQNEQMLAKMTTFHENALALMQERNQMLREIRDSLQNDVAVDQGESSHETTIEDGEDPPSALTIHAAYSINPPQSHVSSSNETLTNPTLIFTNPSDIKTATMLSSIQLEDGTVLPISSIAGTHHQKNVLTNLGTFPQSVIPNMSLLQSGLVSVVGDNTSSTEMTLAMQNPTTSLFQKIEQHEHGN